MHGNPQNTLRHYSETQQSFPSTRPCCPSSSCVYVYRGESSTAAAFSYESSKKNQSIKNKSLLLCCYDWKLLKTSSVSRWRFAKQQVGRPVPCSLLHGRSSASGNASIPAEPDSTIDQPFRQDSLTPQRKGLCVGREEGGVKRREVTRGQTVAGSSVRTYSVYFHPLQLISLWVSIGSTEPLQGAIPCFLLFYEQSPL